MFPLVLRDVLIENSRLFLPQEQLANLQWIRFHTWKKKVLKSLGKGNCFWTCSLGFLSDFYIQKITFTIASFGVSIPHPPSFGNQAPCWGPPVPSASNFHDRHLSTETSSHPPRQQRNSTRLPATAHRVGSGFSLAAFCLEAAKILERKKREIHKSLNYINDWLASCAS